MKEIDAKLLKLIRSFSFLADPIVLLSTNSDIHILDFKKQTLDFKYPHICKYTADIPEIKMSLGIIKDMISSSEEDNSTKEEYLKRVNDFCEICKLIELFCKEDEQEKYDILNHYYAISIDKIQEILSLKKPTISFFENIEAILSPEQQKIISEIKLDATEIQSYFIEALRYLGLEKHWEVQIGDTTSIVHTNFTTNGGQIIIPRKREMTFKKLLGLIIHEIDGHCVQFSNGRGLASGSIRYAQSESILEGYAFFLECFFLAQYFGENKAKELFEKRESQLQYLLGETDHDSFVDNYKGNIFRIFRGFRDFRKYTNNKDLVYLLGLSETLNNYKCYSNYQEIVSSGVINTDYIKKHGIISNGDYDTSIEDTAAVYILKKYLHG